ncbi:hypothetical protein [Pedobacter foliorum]|uniref:hypothetical protein n=1 Tax=Pedobacter foliorum TaxID=2739058 RepID=UPI0015656356|nr:hypothetical protein [Pedobacter foliorum]NRF37408.1 hypothetical protein [Pedobacter foliorum]
MLKQTSARMLAELERELGRIEVQLADPLDRLVQGLKLVREALAKLKTLVLAAPFESEATEVYFLKGLSLLFIGI